MRLVAIRPDAIVAQRRKKLLKADMADTHSPAHAPAAARLLGLSGLLPQLAALGAALAGPEAWFFPALASGYLYAVLIFSFLGGTWWGLAARSAQPPGWAYVLAVLPSLIALASAVPWMTGDPWPQPSLMLIGTLILLSPLVDRALTRAGMAPRWWLGLRVQLSVGLGLATLALGIVPAPY
jgi:hypothetical protein